MKVSRYLYVLVLTLFFFEDFSQTNNPGAYCVGSYSNVPCSGPGPSNAIGNTSNDFIDSLYTVGANINLNTVSPGCNGLPNNYIYYCDQPLVCSAGQSIQLNLKSGYTYSQAFYLFIDWNQNFQFDLPAELIGYTNPVVLAATWTNIMFQVPGNAPNGTFRMRIRSLWNSFGPTATPCGSYQWGETEDYNIIIGSVTPSVVTTATAISNYSICSGQTASFQIQTAGAPVTSYFWTGPSGFTTSIQNPVVYFVPPGYTGFFHCSMGTGTCPLLASTYLWVLSTPTLQINSNYTTICMGNTIQLSSSGYTAVTWQPGGSTNLNINISPLTSTIYTLSAQPAYGCHSSQTIGITVKPNYTVQITASPTLVCAGETVYLQASGAVFYLWSISQSGSQVAFQPTSSTIVSVTGSGSLCSASSSVEITVDLCKQLDEFSKNNLRLSYQNPFTSLFTMQSQTPVEVTFFSIEGKKLFSLSKSTQFEVATADLPSGIYLVRITDEQSNATIKVIKD